MFYQTDSFRTEAVKYACFAFCHFFLKDSQMKQKDADELWVRGLNAKVISGDLNQDGDMDDRGEAEILGQQKFIDWLKIPYKVVFRGSYEDSKIRVNPITDAIIIEGQSPRGGSHFFVAGFSAEKKLFVRYDPIRGGSITASRIINHTDGAKYVSSVRILRRVTV